MEPTDITIEILKSIRDEIRVTNERLDQTRCSLSERLDQTRDSLSARLDQTNERLDTLGRRQPETEVRLSTELVALASAVNDVRDLLRDRLDLSAKVTTRAG